MARQDFVDLPGLEGPNEGFIAPPNSPVEDYSEDFIGTENGNGDSGEWEEKVYHEWEVIPLMDKILATQRALLQAKKKILELQKEKKERLKEELKSLKLKLSPRAEEQQSDFEAEEEDLEKVEKRFPLDFSAEDKAFRASLPSADKDEGEGANPVYLPSSSRSAIGSQMKRPLNTKELTRKRGRSSDSEHDFPHNPLNESEGDHLRNPSSLLP